MTLTLLSVEIGTVSSSTIAATFSEDVTAQNYKDGVIILKNETQVTFTAERQSDHSVVYYTLDEAATADDLLQFIYKSAYNERVLAGGIDFNVIEYPPKKKYNF